jgi:hypothetical protein
VRGERIELMGDIPATTTWLHTPALPLKAKSEASSWRGLTVWRLFHGFHHAARHAGAAQGSLQARSQDRHDHPEGQGARSTMRTLPARSRPGARWQLRGCIRRPAAQGSNYAPATCCWRRWWPAPASRLWREKRGVAEPEDLSGNLIVQLGLATEDLNRQWYERNSGQTCFERFGIVLLRP